MSPETGRDYSGVGRAVTFSVFDTTFLRRCISLLVGASGVGKSWLKRGYIAKCAARRELEEQGRRLVRLEDVAHFFRATGVCGPESGEAYRFLENFFVRNGLKKASWLEVQYLAEAYHRNPGELPPPIQEPVLDEDEPSTVPHVVDLTISRMDTEASLVRKLHRALGEPEKVPAVFTERLVTSCQAEFRRKRALMLLIDESQRGRPPVLDVLREVHDDGGVPIVLIATPDIDALLARKDLASLRRRIAFREELKPLTVDELGEFLPELSPSLRALAHVLSDGRLGVVNNLLSVAEQFREVNGFRALNVECLAEAARVVPDVRRDAIPNLAVGEAKRRVSPAQAKKAASVNVPEPVRSVKRAGAL